MFKITPKPTFRATVPLSVPGSDKPAAIGVDFRHLSKSALRDYFAGLEGKSDAEALAEVITGWEGVDVPFSADALAQLLDNYPAAAGELFEAFRRELLEARAKN